MKNSWQWKKLGDACKTGSGGTPLKAKKDYYEGGTIPWLLSGEVSQGDVWAATNFITQKGLENSSARVFPKDTVLVAMYGATAGQVGILRFEAATNQAVCGIWPNNQFVPEFLYYFLLSRKDELVSQAAGNAQPNISQVKIKNTDTPIVPLAEQQRIVGILDEAFDCIATAKANAEKSLQNARALFESHLQSVFTQRGDGWVEKPLSGFAQSVSTGPFGSLLHKSDYVSDGVPLVNPINIVNGSIVPDANKMIDPATKQRLQSYVLQQGDIVVGRRGEIGRCAVVEAEQAGWVCGTGCFFIRPLQSVNPYFLANLIRSSNYREQLERASSGATMLNLSNKALGELPVAIPNLLVQNHMLAQLEKLSEETQRLASIYQQKLAALESLKKSMLDQAFSGGM